MMFTNVFGCRVLPWYFPSLPGSPSLPSFQVGLFPPPLYHPFSFVDKLRRLALHLVVKREVNVLYYRPQTKLQKGNVFTPVCHPVHRGEVYPPTQTPPRQTPSPGQTPPRQTPPLLGKHPPGRLPPPRRRPLQWTVRILLESILVLFRFQLIYCFQWSLYINRYKI